MSYLDDWFQTPSDERKRLQEVCQQPRCGHQRYQHGETHQQRQATWRWIEHTPGTCRICKCDAFADPNAITKDEVLDIHESLAQPWHLADIGITGVECHIVITRFLGEGRTIDLACGLGLGHAGSHEAKE